MDQRTSPPARSAPVTAALAKSAYRGDTMIEKLRTLFASDPARLVVVDDGDVLGRIGNRRVLNTVLLASALDTGRIPLGLGDLRAAIRVCVKPSFVDLNLEAIDIAIGE